MPEPTVIETINSIRMLLRENRATEADKDLDALAKKINDELEARKLEVPPPGPLTLKELTLKFYDTLADILGNPPRLLALIVEIKGKQEEE
jgi:hypothetical protein